MTGWTLDIKNMSWVERTTQEVDFVVQALGLRGGERAPHATLRLHPMLVRRL